MLLPWHTESLFLMNRQMSIAQENIHEFSKKKIWYIQRATCIRIEVEDPFISILGISSVLTYCCIDKSRKRKLNEGNRLLRYINIAFKEHQLNEEKEEMIDQPYSKNNKANTQHTVSKLRWTFYKWWFWCWRHRKLGSRDTSSTKEHHKSESKNKPIIGITKAF